MRKAVELSNAFASVPLVVCLSMALQPLGHEDPGMTQNLLKSPYSASMTAKCAELRRSPSGLV